MHEPACQYCFILGQMWSHCPNYWTWHPFAAPINVHLMPQDRWVASGRGSQPCFLWEGNEIGQDRTMTYAEVLTDVCKLANWLKTQGIKKGDAVSLYLPMICELPIAMLACARIGAIHSVVFAGFSSESLSQRVVDCK